MGVSACGRVGDAARRPGTVGRKTRRADGSVRASRQSAPVLSRGVGCDTAQENRTAFNSQRRSVIAASVTTAQNRRRTAQTPTTLYARRVFRPTDRAFSHSGSPIHPLAASPRRPKSWMQLSRPDPWEICLPDPRSTRNDQLPAVQGSRPAMRLTRSPRRSAH